MSSKYDALKHMQLTPEMAGEATAVRMELIDLGVLDYQSELTDGIIAGGLGEEGEATDCATAILMGYPELIGMQSNFFIGYAASRAVIGDLERIDG